MKVANQNLENISKKSFFQYQKLFPVFKKEKSKRYGILSLTLLTLTLFGIFALNPIITTIIELRKTLEDARIVESSLSEKIQNMQTLRAEYDSLGNDLELIENAVPNGPDATQFIGKVQSIASSTGVVLKGLDLSGIALSGNPRLENPNIKAKSQEVESANYQLRPYVFTVAVSGTYPQAREFLETLSSFDRVVDVDNIAVSRESGTSSQIGMSIQGTAYFKQ